MSDGGDVKPAATRAETYLAVLTILNWYAFPQPVEETPNCEIAIMVGLWQLRAEGGERLAPGNLYGSVVD